VTSGPALLSCMLAPAPGPAPAAAALPPLSGPLPRGRSWRALGRPPEHQGKGIEVDQLHTLTPEEASAFFDDVWLDELAGVDYWTARVRTLAASIGRGSSPRNLAASRAECLHLEDLARALQAALLRMAVWGATPGARAHLSRSTFALCWTKTHLAAAADRMTAVLRDTAPAFDDDQVALLTADLESTRAALLDALDPAQELVSRLSEELRALDSALVSG
jgi:hypothetical protein